MPLTRNYPPIDSFNFEDLETSTQDYCHTLGELAPLLDIPLIEKAYRIAWKAHRTQRRKSGELYIGHPVAVSLICATQNMDTTTVVASLLHDVVEDTPITKEEITELFGKPVAQLVDGVTKIASLAHGDKKEQQAETYRKMLLTTAQDIRVIIIKFADRIHNLQTLQHMPQHKRERIAQESLDIYAPLAHRLGMRAIKVDLEDLAFRYLYPADYEEVHERITSKKEIQEEIITSFSDDLKKELETKEIIAEVAGRQKHLYSIYNKHTARKVPYDEIYDILAMRVICGTRDECYKLLGIIHALWSPVPDKLKDYIANKKPNGYQSIHTTVADKMGNLMEVQIRTWEMHYIAEEGVAAHWRYKRNNDTPGSLQETTTLSWLRNLVEWQQEISDSVEFYEFFKVDIEHQNFTAFTPKKQEVNLPMGATVLDFAYAIHTNLGNHCIGAKVNGIMIEGRSHILKQGDTVKIFTDQVKTPQISWLNELRTPRARSAIKRWLSKEQKITQYTMGKKLLYSSFDYLRSPKPLSAYIQEILVKFSISSEEELFTKIGSAQLESEKVIQYIKMSIGQNQPKIRQLVQAIGGGKATPRVTVDGMKELMIRYAPCCHPLPGDPIIGFLTSGRGIVVHRKDCSTAKFFANDTERTVLLTWDYGSTSHALEAPLTLIVQKRRGLIKDVAMVLDQYDIDIVEITSQYDETPAVLKLIVHTKKVSELQRLCTHFRKIKGVKKVIRDKS